MDELNIIGAVINTLDRISVPVTLIEQIGIPVYNSSFALKDVFNKLKEKKQTEETENNTNKDDDIKIEPVSVNEEEIKMEVNN